MQDQYQKKAKRKLITVILYLLLLIGCTLFLKGQNTERVIEDDVLELHFLSLKKADCILIRTGKKAMLIDAGWKDTKRQVTDYLKKQGIKRLDYVVATHGDEDHVGGMEEVLRKFQVETLFISPKNESNKDYQAMIGRAKKRQTKIIVPKVPSEFSFGNAKIKILAPGTAALADGQTNNSSLVLYITFGSRNFLFMGDALKESEAEILKKGYEIQADVLKVGHHGFNDATTEAFLETVAPKLAIITCEKKQAQDKANNFGRIEPMLKEKEIELYYTGDGTLFLSCDGEKIEVQHDTK